LAAELKRTAGVEAELIAGSHGIFEVKVDGKTIYSKDKTGRFPIVGEVSELLQGKAAQ